MNFFYTFPLSTLSSAMCRVAVAESKLSRTRNSKLWLSRQNICTFCTQSIVNGNGGNGKMKISRTSQLKKESERGEGEGEMRRPQGKGNYIAIGKVIEN